MTRTFKSPTNPSGRLAKPTRSRSQVTPPPNIFDESQTRQYLTALFGRGLSLGGAINVTAFSDGPQKTVCCLPDIDEVIAAVEKWKHGGEFMIHTSLVDAAKLKQRAIEAEQQHKPGSLHAGNDEIHTVVCLGLDCDAGKDGKFLSRDEMLELLHGLPMPPSMIVSSRPGKGLHPYWILERPIVISDCEHLAEINARFRSFWLDIAGRVDEARPGAVIDSIYSASRVLRLPGTMRGDDRVELLELHTDRLYSLDDISLPGWDEVPKIDYSSSAGGTGPVEQYIDREEITVSDLLVEMGASHDGGDRWSRPGGSAGGYIIHRSEKTGRWGVTVHSRNCDLLGDPESIDTPWRSDAAMFVAIRFAGDWTAAAAFCRDAMKPTVAEMFSGVDVQLPVDVGDVVADSVKRELGRTRGEFWNYENRKGEEDKVIKCGIELPELINPFLSQGWPKLCGGQLFAPDPWGGVVTMRSASELFAWIGKHRQVCWADKCSNAVTKTEFFSGLQQNAESVDSIEATPHYPPVPRVHYLDPIEPGNVEDLYAFARHFSPAKGADERLIIAAIVSPFWGGPGGQRPLITVTSEDSQGAGKSTLVNAISNLVGMGRSSHLQIKKPADFEELPKLLGSRSPVNPTNKRLITVDNFRGASLGASDIESMITEESLSVWKIYQGEVSIPNLYQWYCTGNHIAMTEDLAQRNVEIRIRKPKSFSAEWQLQLAEWDLRRVVAGIGAFFELPRIAEMSAPTRFPMWCRDVLGRMEGAEELVKVINARNAEMSIDGEDGEEMEYWFREFLRDPGTAGFRFPSEDGSEWYRMEVFAEYLRKRRLPCPFKKGWSANTLSRRIGQLENSMPNVEKSRTKAGSFIVWRPSSGDASSE